ncbi:MAG TPA: GFA family protein [Hyphomicrobiaceae bacterium]|nr:GFA family protein [Hyphomicrobiaceae bacterium]
MSGAQGGCLCGGLRYKVQSPPSRVTICHCRFCQRATGSAYLVEPIFDKQGFSLTKGNAKVYVHRSEGSGQQVYVNFCDTCGTKLFLGFDRWPDIVGVYGGTFDDPNWYERTSENSKQIFLGVAQAGTVIPPGVNTFKEHATTIDGTPIEPTVFAKPEIICRSE